MGSNPPESSESTMLLCPSCGYPYRPGELFCSHCNHRFSQAASTHRINIKDAVRGNQPQPTGEAIVPGPKPIVFQIDDEQVTLPQDFSEIVIGRRSPVISDQQPDIDLSPYGADRTGVSRRHAALKRKNNLTYVVDLGSSNGTWLNGKRLIGPAERLLRGGDELQLGTLKLIVRF